MMWQCYNINALKIEKSEFEGEPILENKGQL